MSVQLVRAFLTPRVTLSGRYHIRFTSEFESIGRMPQSGRPIPLIAPAGTVLLLYPQTFNPVVYLISPIPLPKG
jgi:hypothetical protein